MAEVKLEIADRNYIVTCRDGEEAHLEKLGRLVNKKAEEAGASAPGLNESRMLLFAALLLADQISEQSGGNGPASAAASATLPNIDDNALSALEKLAERVESLANSLEQ